MPGSVGLFLEEELIQTSVASSISKAEGSKGTDAQGLPASACSQAHLLFLHLSHHQLVYMFFFRSFPDTAKVVLTNKVRFGD